MKKILTLIIALMWIAVPAVVYADWETKIVGEDEVVEGDYFGYGRRVEILGRVTGDAYVGGEEVIVRGEVEGDLLAAGARVVVEGRVGQDIRAAGETVEISGEVGKNVTVAGRRVAIEEEADLGGSMVGAGEWLTVRSELPGALKAAGGTVEINDRVGRDAQVGAGKLVLGPEARLVGKLDYWSQDEAQVDKGASVAAVAFNRVEGDDGRVIRERTPRGVGVGNLVGLLMSLFTGLVLLRLFPGWFDRAAEMISRRPWLSVGWGFVLMFFIPLAMILLMVTIAGIPLALILLLVWLVLMYLGGLWVAMALGRWLVERMGRDWSRSLTLVLGLIVSAVIGAIPVVGWIWSIGVLLAGLGVWWLVWMENRTQGAKA